MGDLFRHLYPIRIVSRKCHMVPNGHGLRAQGAHLGRHPLVDLHISEVHPIKILQLRPERQWRHPRAEDALLRVELPAFLKSS